MKSIKSKNKCTEAEPLTSAMDELEGISRHKYYFSHNPFISLAYNDINLALIWTYWSLPW